MSSAEYALHNAMKEVARLKARVAELERERDEAREDATFGERYVADQWREANETLRTRLASLEAENGELRGVLRDDALPAVQYMCGFFKSPEGMLVVNARKKINTALAKPEGGEKVPIREGQPRKPGKVAPEDVEIDSDN